jgi:tRNA pseudouridine13 synthase
MHFTKTPGTGGRIASEEDFVVEEIPSKKFFRKYERIGGSVQLISGPYFVYLLKKKGMTTKKALEIVSRKNGIPVNSIGYSGLKDKFAVTSQYITIKKKIDSFETGNLSLIYSGSARNQMQIGELDGNHFIITLHKCRRPKNAKKTLAILGKGLPNYFGPQRFGINRNNHEIGKLILKRKFDQALDLINKNYSRTWSSIRLFDKKLLKFFIHSYQSYIFNKLLDQYVESGRLTFSVLPVPGFDSSHELLKKEGLQPSDFEIKDLGIKCLGGTRQAKVIPSGLEYQVNGKTLTLHFTLPPGSYATVLIEEVVKNGSSL